MNSDCPLVCNIVIRKRDYPIYEKYLEQGKTDPNTYLPYGINLYRVTHHLKEIPIDNHSKYRSRLRYCIPEEATWISGVGVDGILCPISDVILLHDAPQWSPDRILAERAAAISPFWINDELKGWDLKVSHEGKLIVT